MGHGEWNPIEQTQTVSPQGEGISHEPDWVKQWLQQEDQDICRNEQVRTKGYPNRWGARIQVQSKWNLEYFQDQLHNYHDQEVVEWLRYGWPAGRLPSLPLPGLSTKNHKGAEEHPQELDKYIKKELKYEAIMGPYKKIPFTHNVGISPLSTRPKKDSADRQVILDLSFPIGDSVNDGIPKDLYLGFTAQLTFPKTDDYAFRIFHLGLGCYMFKIDLSRYFREIPLDPGDYSLIGYIVKRNIL